MFQNKKAVESGSGFHGLIIVVYTELTVDKPLPWIVPPPPAV
jgi:hypothetical protein